ncbi:amino acid adenylation domain-containing protein [Marininema mesophilum]|uniref:Amino acid adenylation domain-containing protein n=1 Tax=Marininema mesophilum TaxID=1048340 RepID=A0A1H2Q9M2_9BACL|nr:amino acid adenylation domain-containing protein [Marininema mesophilum]SDW03851.1 amino acid adenylation domain-containing protein [Marininema mesophilum]
MNPIMQLFFEAQVKRTPDAVAVTFGKQSLTYRELNTKSNQLASCLRKRGVGPETIVGVMVERSLEMMIGIFGILKAGGAYLPLSLSYPKKRLQYIVEDSGMALVLTQSNLLQQLKESIELAALSLDDATLYIGSGENLPCLNQPADLVYVIYTSGSTGKPKGVMIEHRALVNRLEWMQEAYPIDSQDTLLQKTPVTFDVSVWEIFWWSMVGAKVCLLAPGMEKFPQAIIEGTKTMQVTVMHFVPSMMNAFLNYIEGADEIDQLTSLRRVFVSGEALISRQVKKFNDLLHRTNGTRLTNLYGPTEATIDVSAYDCPTKSNLEENIPIGRAIRNIDLFVIDDKGHPLPRGQVGELCIAGIGLARGYVNNPSLTAERFIENEEGQRMYRTGDLALRRLDGNIEYHGRIDHQVKIRGLRIELGEIEACAMACAGIQQCVVLVRRESETVVKLVAYYEASEGFQSIRLKKHLRLHLPDYMVPSSYIHHRTLPLTENGKVDRKLLATWVASKNLTGGGVS